ncbi:glycosyltransferase [Agromyces binzhouensis]|uniref:glycosyltransferase n=1 Tax=Agromyces binzhouensis TaxID=1817495 RepID=UPI00363E12AB
MSASFGNPVVLAPGSDNRLLLAASTGGHLAQLVRLAPGLGANDESVWVTFRSPQSESLLGGRRVLFVPYIGPRDARSIARAFAEIRVRIRGDRFDAAVSTGSGIALAALPAAHLAGMKTVYIESFSRVEAPSLSGRILAGARFTEMRTQHPGWANGRWSLHGSVLDTYRSEPRPVDGSRPLRIFVTLGTIQGYEFRSLVDRVLELGLANDETVWQLGSTRANTALPGTVRSQVSASEFEARARNADVVITHAGVGTLISLFEMGVYPLAVVRRKARGEHVDDHQAQIAKLVDELGIASTSEVEDLDGALVAATARRRINVDLVAR